MKRKERKKDIKPDSILRAMWPKVRSSFYEKFPEHISATLSRGIIAFFGFIALQLILYVLIASHVIHLGPSWPPFDDIGASLIICDTLGAGVLAGILWTLKRRAGKSVKVVEIYKVPVSDDKWQEIAGDGLAALSYKVHLNYDADQKLKETLVELRLVNLSGAPIPKMMLPVRERQVSSDDYPVVRDDFRVIEGAVGGEVKPIIGEYENNRQEVPLSFVDQDHEHGIEAGKERLLRYKLVPQYKFDEQVRLVTPDAYITTLWPIKRLVITVNFFPDAVPPHIWECYRDGAPKSIKQKNPVYNEWGMPCYFRATYHGLSKGSGHFGIEWKWLKR